MKSSEACDETVAFSPGEKFVADNTNQSKTLTDVQNARLCRYFCYYSTTYDNCLAWSYTLDTKECSLMKTITKKVPDTQAISGIKMNECDIKNKYGKETIFKAADCGEKLITATDKRAFTLNDFDLR